MGYGHVLNIMYCILTNTLCYIYGNTVGPFGVSLGMMCYFLKVTFLPPFFLFDFALEEFFRPFLVLLDLPP